MKVTIQVNGKKEDINENITIMGLLNLKKINPGIVVVELNGKIIDRNKYDQTNLKSNDKVELVFYMGGGKENEI